MFRATLDAIPGNKILVGHSYGGMVISGRGVMARSDVLGLVYAAGFRAGRGRGQRSACWRRTLRPKRSVTSFPIPFRSFTSTQRSSPGVFCQDLSPKKAAELNAGQRPISLGAGSDPAGPPAWRTLPSWYAISGQDRVINPDLQAGHVGARRWVDGHSLRRREPRGRVHPLRESPGEAHRGRPSARDGGLRGRTAP